MKIPSKAVTLKNDLSVVLRSATAADAEKLLRHLRVSHSESYRNLNQTAEYWNAFSTSEQEKLLLDYEASPSKFMLVAVCNDRVVGGLGFWGYQAELVKHSATIGMSLQKEFSGIGLGTVMITYMLEQAKLAGFRSVDLRVRTYNEAGINLYEKVGFERVGVFKDTAFVDGEFMNEYAYQKILV